MANGENGTTSVRRVVDALVKLLMFAVVGWLAFVTNGVSENNRRLTIIEADTFGQHQADEDHHETWLAIANNTHEIRMLDETKRDK